MSTDLSGSFAISAMQSALGVVLSGSSFLSGLVRGRERPTSSVTGRVMIMSGDPRMLDSRDESGGTRGQGDRPAYANRVDENKRNPLRSLPQHIESKRIHGTQSLVV